MNFLFSCLVVLGSLGLTASTELERRHHHHGQGGSTEFDYFVFAQTWPETNCITWKERGRGNTCFLPSNARWTVHGLWPTKTGTHGPFNCNPNLPFSEDKIKDILPDLEAHWTNVHANSGEFSFWEHEWTKHGTCAAQLPALSDEHKYFAKGMALNNEFPLETYFAAKGIVPGAAYNFDAMLDALQTGLGGKQPLVQCAFDHKNKEHYISQIEICLDKALTIMDCPGAPNHGCSTHGDTIFYPVPEKVDDNFFKMSFGTIEIHEYIRTQGGFTWNMIMVVISLFMMLTGLICACRLCLICICSQRSKSGMVYDGHYGKLNEELMA